MSDEIVLQAEGITKRFPGILANDAVNLTLHKGEILALLGENGAGKSTLMNIIYGLYHPDGGTIQVKGKPVTLASPREAIQVGIGMVHQHFQLIPVMTVAENVTLGEEASVSNSPNSPVQGKILTAVSTALKRGWGVLWRLCLPLLAIGFSLIIGQIVLLLIFTLSTGFLPASVTGSFSFGRLSVAQKANLALPVLYSAHVWFTTAILYSPILFGILAGAAAIFFGVRYARRTWAKLNALPDSVMISALDFFATASMVQDYQQAVTRVRDLSRQYGLEVDPDAIIEKLPIGMQQRVEIIKALYRHADILILDEPTAVLTPQESQELFKIMRALVEQGVSIIFISHKLKEVLSIADTIVVMRAGRVVGTATPAESTEESLAAMMVGREVILKVAKDAATPGDVELRVTDLVAEDDRGAMVLDGLSFEVRVGEVLGIAGVQGNGQTELVEVLTGLRKPTSGYFEISGERFSIATPREITNTNTAHVPEDRQRYGMVMPFPVASNLVLNQYYNNPFASIPSWRQLPIIGGLYVVLFASVFLLGSGLWSLILWPTLQQVLNLAKLDSRKDTGAFVIALLLTILAVMVIGLIAHLIAALSTEELRGRFRNDKIRHTNGLVLDEKAIDGNATTLVQQFDIRTPSIAVNAGNLSGGNQQKMVVAREFSRKPRLLIASQPTRGIDVGAIEFIHQQIIKQRDDGAAVLLVSAELDEILALSDRIAVMYRGRIIDTIPAETAAREQLGLLMAGVKNTDSAS